MKSGLEPETVAVRARRSQGGGDTFPSEAVVDNEDEGPETDNGPETIPAELPDRQAQPVDAEQPPWLPFPVVGIGASAGGLE